jgi:hypothetical protein
MHKLFGWLTEAGIEPNSKTVPNYLTFIDQYEPEPVEIISFARLFYGFKSETDASLDKFGTALQKAEPSFRIGQHKHELSVLAGAELIAVIERYRNNRFGDLAALCLVCGGAQGERTGVPISELPAIAARYIEDRTSKRAQLPRAMVVDDVESSEDDELDSMKAKVGNLERELTIVGEETSMLWWLVSETSRDRKQRWKTVGSPATSIIAGKELSDLTRVIPGPVAAAAFLDRIVRLSSENSPQPVKVKEAIDGTPREWRSQYPSAPSSVVDLTPISNAIRLSLTVAQGDDWLPVFSMGTSLTADSQMQPTVLAYQTFSERLLARLAGELEQ